MRLVREKGARGDSGQEVCGDIGDEGWEREMNHQIFSIPPFFTKI